MQVLKYLRFAILHRKRQVKDMEGIFEEYKDTRYQLHEFLMLASLNFIDVKFSDWEVESRSRQVQIACLIIKCHALLRMFSCR